MLAGKNHFLNFQFLLVEDYNFLSGEYLVASISFFIIIFALEEVLNRADCTLEAMMIKDRMIACKK